MTYQINNTLVDTYFNIGKEIVENEQKGNIRAEYGKEILLKLSRKLTGKYGSGYSRTGLQNMRLFYNKYKNCQPLAGKLSWSHYCYLIYIEDDAERNFYENYEFDNETMGIILCTGKKGVTMEYTLGGLSNNIFASTYAYYIPNKDELINEIERVLKETDKGNINDI